MGKKDKMAAKKNSISEASGNVSNSRLMQNLKTVNACLVKEAAECRKEIERLRIQLTSLVAEEDIFHGIQCDVCSLVVSSSLQEFAARAMVEMATVSGREKDLREKIKAVAREANAEEIELLALAKEKDEKEKELAELKERIRSMEQTSGRERWWRKWFCTALATTFMTAASVILVNFLHRF